MELRNGWNDEACRPFPPRTPQHSRGLSRRQCATIASWRSAGILSGSGWVMREEADHQGTEKVTRWASPFRPETRRLARAVRPRLFREQRSREVTLAQV